MDEYPDSVLQLLNIQPKEIEDFSDKRQLFTGCRFYW